MILPREDVCWVVTPNGECVPFDGAHLAESIRATAGAACETAGLLADSIAAAVGQYARDQAGARPLTTGEIAEMVEAVLDMLGLEDWAAAYVARGQAGEIALDELAGAGWELDFYRRLDAALAARHRGRLRLRGLRGCVLRLRGTQRWGAACRQLADDIVQYVYARAARLRGACGTEFSVSVVE